MTQVKVALLTNFIPPYRVPLLQELAKRVVDLQIFISTPMEPNRLWPVDWQDLNVHVQRTITIQRTWRHPAGFSDAQYVHFPYDTFAQLRFYKPDVILSVELGFRSLQAVIYRSIYKKSRLILWEALTEYTEQGRGRLRNLLRYGLLPHADAVIVKGESGAHYLARFGVPDRLIFQIPDTPPMESFSSVPLERRSNDTIHLLAVGQLIQRKGLVPFLRMLRQWAESNPDRSIEFMCAGSGPLLNDLASQLLPPNLKLSLLGNIKYSDLPTIYAKADILAFPTLADEWGLVVNEAMASGLPVLGSLYSQAVEELVQDGKTGWTFRPDHLDEIADAINRALSTQPEQLVKMRLAARTRALMITPPLIADQFISAIEFVLA
jgi:glycosyltransferase involved in cell wall biosynthesis